MKLFHENVGGNLHQASEIINKYCPEIIPGIITMDCVGGNNTIVVWRAKEEHPFFKRGRVPMGTTPLGVKSHASNEGPQIE